MQKEIDAGYNFKNFSDILFQPPQGQCSLAQQVQSKRCKDTNSSLSEVAFSEPLCRIPCGHDCGMIPAPLAYSCICVPVSGCSSPSAHGNLGKCGKGKRQEGGSLHFPIRKNFIVEALCKLDIGSNCFALYLG